MQAAKARIGQCGERQHGVARSFTPNGVERASDDGMADADDDGRRSQLGQLVCVTVHLPCSTRLRDNYPGGRGQDRTDIATLITTLTEPAGLQLQLPNARSVRTNTNALTNPAGPRIPPNPENRRSHINVATMTAIAREDSTASFPDALLLSCLADSVCSSLQGPRRRGSWFGRRVALSHVQGQGPFRGVGGVESAELLR